MKCALPFDIGRLSGKGKKGIDTQLHVLSLLLGNYLQKTFATHEKKFLWICAENNHRYTIFCPPLLFSPQTRCLSASSLVCLLHETFKKKFKNEKKVQSEIKEWRLMVRIHRFCAPRSQTPPPLLAYLVATFPYANETQWLHFLDAGYVTVERMEPSSTKHAQQSRKNQRSSSAHCPPPLSEESDASEGLSVVALCGTSEETKRVPPEKGLTTLFTDQVVLRTLILRQGDRILFDPPRELEPPVDDKHIERAWEDDLVLVAVKNGNLPVAEGGRYSKNTLVWLLQQQHTEGDSHPPALLSCRSQRDVAEEGRTLLTAAAAPKTDADQSSHNALRSNSNALGCRLFPCHRLDKETSGLVLLGKSSHAASFLSSQFGVYGGGDDEGDVSRSTAAVAVAAAAAAGRDTVDPNECDGRRGPVGGGSTTTGRCHALKRYRLIVKGAVDLTSLVAAAATASDGTTNGASSVSVDGEFITVTANVGFQAEGGATLRGCAVEGDSGPSTASKAQEAGHNFEKLIMAVYPEGSPFGKRAKTVFRVLATDPARKLSLLEATLFTGRTHQIRLHAAHLGYPILGDKLYETNNLACGSAMGASCAVPAEVYLARTRGEVAVEYSTEEDGDGTSRCRRWRLHRHMLHAAFLSFVHPTTRERVEVVSDCVPWFTRDCQEVLSEESPTADGACPHSPHLFEGLFARAQ
jgi:23S rRNA-/tRNA-specific pseudouridylate synthase